MQKTKVACPLCNRVFDIADASPLGKSLRCQNCGAPFTVAAGDLCGTQATPRQLPALTRPGSPGDAAAADEPWWVQAQRLMPPTAAATPQVPSQSVVPAAAAPSLARQQTPALSRVEPPAPAAHLPWHSGDRLLVLGAVFAGLTLLLGVSAAVAVVCFSIGPDQPSVAKTPEIMGQPKDPQVPAQPEKAKPGKNKLQNPAPQQQPMDQQPPDRPEQPPQPPQPAAKDVAKGPAPEAAKGAADPRPPVPDKGGVAPIQQNMIDNAINRGVTFLKSQQGKDGNWATDFIIHKGMLTDAYALGPTSLAALTLLECGVSPAHPHIVKAAGFVRNHWQNDTRTYELSLTLLFLDKLAEKKDKPIIQGVGLRLISRQTQNGGWSYNCPILSNQQATKLLTALQKNRPKAPSTAIDKGDKNPLPIPVDKRESSPLPVPVPNGDKPQLPDTMVKQVALQPRKGLGWLRDDNSNTQFAMLALWAARRHDIPVEKTLALAEQRFRVSQLASGAWAYLFHGDMAKPSMTCVGLLGIALGKGSAAEVAMRGNGPGDPGGPALKPGGVDDQVRKGLNALNLQSNQIDYQNSLYFLWSIERIGVLYNLTKIDGRDWYQWGAGMLLPAQRGNGSWETHSYAGSNSTIDSSFALLFLKRVNLAQDLTDLNLRMAIPDPRAVPPKDQ